jgi:glycosyltransferase involved in cell wall biosynthesis
MNQDAQTISVVIPAYNAAATIVRALDSVLRQTVQPAEILVIDDGSADKTPETVAAYGGKVRLVRQANAGAAAARNAGIQHAGGEWIAFLDADDEWLDTYLERQVTLLAQNPGLVWSSANYELCYCTENRRVEYLPAEAGRRLLNQQTWFDDYFQAFIRHATGCMDTMIVKRHVLLDAGGFPSRSVAEDLDLWWRIAYRYPAIGYLPEPLAVYHFQVSDSLTKTHTSPTIIDDLLTTHWKLAKASSATDRFEPCAAHVLRFWLNEYLHDERIEFIPGLLKRHGHLLSPQSRILLRLLTVCPRAAQKCIPLLGRASRAVGIRIQ